jgi:predicted nuclease with RNAse H fold
VCDAVLAAYTAWLYAEGRAEALGWPDEAQIVVPKG